MGPAALPSSARATPPATRSSLRTMSRRPSPPALRPPRRRPPRVRRVSFVAASAGACALGVLLAPRAAHAVDVGVVGGDSLQLDVTETSIVAQHFDARDNELRQDSGWGGWINRLDAALRWGQW